MKLYFIHLFTIIPKIPTMYLLPYIGYTFDSIMVISVQLDEQVTVMHGLLLKCLFFFLSKGVLLLFQSNVSR